MYVFQAMQKLTNQHYYLNKRRGSPQRSRILVNLYKEAV